MKKLLTAISSVLILSVSSAVFAADVSINSTAFQEVIEKNEKNVDVISLIKLDKTVPGAIVVFKNEIKNNGTKPANNIVINNPISEQLIFIENNKSSVEADVSYSIDGKEYAKAGVLKIKDVNGSERLARPDDYRYIAWKLYKPLNAGETVELGYRASVK